MREFEVLVRGLCAYLGLGLLPGCQSESRPTYVASPAIQHDAAFVLSFSGESTVLRGPLLSAAPRGVEVDVAESGAVVYLAIAASALAAFRPDASTRLADLRLVEASQTCALERAEDGAFRRPVTELGRVFELEQEEFRESSAERANGLLAGWSLEVPRDELRCGQSPPSPSPFGERASLLLPGASVFQTAIEDGDASRTAHLEQVLYLDQDRVVARSRNTFYLFERGRAFVDDPAHRLRPGPGAASGVYSEPLEDGRFRLFLTTSLRGADEEPLSGTLASVIVGPSGFGPVVTETVSVPLAGVTVEPRTGTIVAVGHDGWVLSAPRLGGPYRLTAITALMSAAQVVATGRRNGLPELVVQLSDSLVAVGQVNLASQPEFELEGANAPWPNSRALAIDLEGGRIVAFSRVGTALLRSPEGVWSPLEFELAESARTCATLGPCGERLNTKFVGSAIVADVGMGPRLLFQAEGCERLTMLRLEDTCASAFALPNDLGSASALGAGFGRVLIGGRDGALLELAPSP